MVQPSTTNNQMELQAVLEGLKCFMLEIGVAHNELHLYSDSMYLVSGIEIWMGKWAKKGWIKKDEKPVLNQILWKEIYLLKQNINLVCHHIKGHAGHTYNEKVDQLAFGAASKAKQIYGANLV
jgi:ribonuclease HI